MPAPSPTLAAMAEQSSPSISLFCTPCGRLRVYEPSDLIAFFGPAFTMANLKNRLVCGQCGMPVDDEFRTLAFRCAED